MWKYLVAEAWAMGPPPGAKSSPLDILVSFLPIGLIFVVFWFILIRPQMKKQKETQDMISALKQGDNVLTTGGIYGSIVKIKENVITLQVADGVRLKVDKSAVSGVVSHGSVAESDK